ncbi:ABC transporter ATP-binding protein [Metasolibacillus sp. FSL K6-0083]|uniref:ABC transporter ATP-binding protein n=1 Tax=Metasolibacillus sp. FSL K6-0083 TaxID=2921416 RepID=UPI00315B37E6
MIQVMIEEAGYEQSKIIIENIDFSIPSGQMVGLIGGNGAGKSTTIQTLLGVIPYYKGNLSVPECGFVPERPILYTYYTLREHIHLLVNLIQKAGLWNRALELCNLFRLDKHLDEYPTSFSKGMQQKVMLILAFTPKYDFYILDEPFMGLDPQAIRRLLILLEQVKTDGAAILISTHALDTAQQICDSFVCLHEGRLIRRGTLKEMQEKEGQTLLEIFDELIEGTSDAII